MSRPLRLVLFDVDGTLVDSQADILAAMALACGAVDVPCPPREEVLSNVGLSLDVMMPRIAPDLSDAGHAQMVAAYKEAYMSLRAEQGVAASSPLYPGARDVLQRLHAVPEVLLGVATGKSKRGLDKLIDGHDLHGLFVTQQVADFHPSKPHPAMIEAAIAETGVSACDVVMIGDTSFDMQMAHSAQVASVGVTWGYHPVDNLGQARYTINDFNELEGVLDLIWDMQK